MLEMLRYVAGPELFAGIEVDEGRKLENVGWNFLRDILLLC